MKFNFIYGRIEKWKFVSIVGLWRLVGVFFNVRIVLCWGFIEKVIIGWRGWRFIDVEFKVWVFKGDFWNECEMIDYINLDKLFVLKIVYLKFILSCWKV